MHGRWPMLAEVCWWAGWAGHYTEEDVDSLLFWAKVASQEAEAMVNMETKDRRDRWHDKLEEAARGMAAGLRRMSKQAGAWRPRADYRSLGDAANPLEAAEAAKKAWVKDE